MHKFILHNNSLFLEFLPASMASMVARGKIMTRTSEVEDRMSCSSESISVFSGILEECSLGEQMLLGARFFPFGHKPVATGLGTDSRFLIT